jgi:hypothetical protein
MALDCLSTSHNPAGRTGAASRDRLCGAQGTDTPMNVRLGRETKSAYSQHRVAARLRLDRLSKRNVSGSDQLDLTLFAAQPQSTIRLNSIEAAGDGLIGT